MKCWVVPSSLFVSGQIMAPIRIQREQDALIARQARLQAELAALPGRIHALEQDKQALAEEYTPFAAMERGGPVAPQKP